VTSAAVAELPLSAPSESTMSDATEMRSRASSRSANFEAS
jgi:hypothetical protein